MADMHITLRPTSIEEQTRLVMQSAYQPFRDRWEQNIRMFKEFGKLKCRLGGWVLDDEKKALWEKTVDA